jgi:hypothetical protein
VIRILAIFAAGSLVTCPLRAASEPSLHFENDIEPIFSRYNCNASGCHGKAEGQGGFKLSVFAFDSEADRNAIVKDGRGRRVVPAAPDESLLLLKATGRVPHGGGIRLKVESRDYQTLRNWIAVGMPAGDPNAPRVRSVTVEPTEKILAPMATQQLRVFATYTDGRKVEVTDHARFQANHEGLATVSSTGLVSTLDRPGEVAVMAAYMGHVGLFRAIVPRPGKLIDSPRPQFNAIDKHVDRKLSKLNITPSELCDDAEFLRRVTLDLAGALPTPAEVRAFLADRTSDKRSKRIDELLARPSFADLMALRWADVLRVDRQALGHERAYAYHRWIRESFAKNRPLDEFAREIITAEGLLQDTPQAAFYRAATKPGEMASTLSQVFLGVRIACAECHHHPSDRWSQTDYTGMVAFFTPVSTRGVGKNEAILSQGNPLSRHPRSGLPVTAHALGTEPPSENPTGDRRGTLAEWMTNLKNPYFARNLANRTWAKLLGRGIVEPVDDVRATNPPSNPELLDALAAYLVEKKFDLRALVKFICESRTYQASSRPNETNEKDDLNFSRGLFKRLEAEVLLDAIGQATGVPDRFAGMPPGSKAIELWDSKVKNEFLKLFGRPQRTTACDCERTVEPSTGQVLNLLNSVELQKKLSHDAGLVSRLTQRFPDDAKLIEELYLTLLARFPTARERDTTTSYLQRAGKERRQAVEDLAWALLNSLEFVFNH